MENLLYMFAVVTVISWLAGIALIALFFRVTQNKNKFNKPKIWVESNNLNS